MMFLVCICIEEVYEAINPMSINSINQSERRSLVRLFV